METETLTIDRTQWSRGNLTGNALRVGHSTASISAPDSMKPRGLASPTFGNFCCLGIFCIQLRGCTADELTDIGMPSSLERLIKTLVVEHESDHGPTGTYDDTKFAQKAASINDDEAIDEETREARLVQHFAEQNINLQFIN